MRYFGIVVSMSPERRRQVYETVADLSAPTRSFYIMVAISTTIASYGLLANSTAVVIGAMLVAPLMGPIFGIALSLSTGDRSLLPKSATSELLGIALAILLGLLIGLVPLRLAFGSEIVARTEPTIYDIVIALASGLAGAYAMMDEKISPALPGVAIATALVPPLATCGLCLATAHWEWAGGAFLLFFANFLAIQIAASFIFTSYGMAEVQPYQSFTLGHFIKRFALSLVLLAAVAVYMTRTLVRMVSENHYSQTIESTLSKSLRTSTGAQLSDVRIERRGDVHEVVATVLTPRAFESDQIVGMEKKLSEAAESSVHLIVRSLISSDMDGKGPVFIADEDREKRAVVAEQTQFLTLAQNILKEGLSKIAGARLVDVNQIDNGIQTDVTAVVRTPSAIDPEQVAAMESDLSNEAGKPISLIVRSVLTRDADARGYIYEGKKETVPLTPREQALHNRLQSALENQLSHSIQGASMSEFRYKRLNGRLLILAVVRTPVAINSVHVKRIEWNLRQYVDPTVNLVVRSNVEADAASGGYLQSFDDSVLSPLFSREPRAIAQAGTE